MLKTIKKLNKYNSYFSAPTKLQKAVQSELKKYCLKNNITSLNIFGLVELSNGQLFPEEARAILQTINTNL